MTSARVCSRLAAAHLLTLAGLLLPSAALAQLGSQFIAVGERGAILTSSDGASWVQRPTGATARLRAVTVSGTLAATVGEGGAILTSLDGATWTTRTVPVAETLRGVATGAGRTVAVGGQVNAVILGSADGVTWVQETAPALPKLRSIAWSGTRFLAVGAGGAACTSPDGRTWTTVNPGLTERLDLVVWHDGTFKVVSETGRVATSTDGVAWSFSQVAAPTWLEGVAPTPSGAIAVGAAGRILTTTTGTTWQGRSSGLGLTLHGVVWTGTGSAAALDPVAALGTLGQVPQPTVTVAAPAAGGAVTLGYSATGATATTLQWLLNGVPLAGATSGTFTVSAGALRRGSLYSVRASNAAGEGISAPELVLPTGPAPTGALWGMGRDTAAQLGVGRPPTRTEPIPVAADVTAVRYGYGHLLYLRSDGSLWGVGENDLGQLGAGASLYVTTPVRIATGVISLAGGTNHTLYVRSDGTLWALGHNGSGQLGLGDLNNRSTPVQVTTGVSQVWAGGSNTAFLKQDGTLWTMGDNTYGAVGAGLPGKSSTPTQLAAGVRSAAVGVGHLLFVKTDHTLWGQGRNLYGQLGLGNLLDQTAPVLIASDVDSVSAGYSHTHFIRRDATLWAMGLNSAGQLGNGTATQASSPVQVATGVLKVSGGSRHTLWLTQDGSLWGTGWAGYGTLLGSGGTTSTPRLLNAGNRDLSAGGDSSAYVKQDGALWVAGLNHSGKIGDGLPIFHATPVLIDPAGAAAAAASSLNSIYVKADQTVWGFGWPNGGGGLGTTAQSHVSPNLTATGATAVAAGGGYSLLLGADGSVRATGANDVGQLGDGTLTTRTAWTTVATGAVAIAAGSDHSALISQDGTLRTSGLNTYGQLGLGHTTTQTSFNAVDSEVVAVACGALHTLYLRRDGTVWSFGRNLYGQLGDGSKVNRLRPVLVATGAVGVAAGGSHSLQLRQDGSLWSYGRGAQGQLGSGSTSDRSLPGVVAQNVVRVAGGYEGSYFITTDGTLWATGDNVEGELGIGSLTQQNSPVAVARNVLAVAAVPVAEHMLFVQAPDSAGTPPTFQQAPQSTQLATGQALLLSAAATGDGPIDLQWFRNGQAVPGAKGREFSIPFLRATDAGVYHVVATNLAGTATSAPALVSVAGSTGAQFAVVGEGGAILTSPDGLTWTARTSPVTRRLRAIVGTPSQFIAVGEAGNMVGSTDGAAWFARPSGVAHTLRGIAVSPAGHFAAVGGESASLVLHSADGVNWRSASVLGTARLRAVAWGGDRFLAVGANGAAYTSPDGQAWTPRATGATERLDGVLWTGSVFQVISERGLVYSSPDGIAWTVSSARPPAWAEAFAWDGTRHLVVGAAGRIALAGSGASWNFPGSGTRATLHGVAWSGTVTTPPTTSALAADLLRQAPVIRDQPTGASRFTGETVALAVTATGGGPLQYQWHREGVPLPGATGGNLRLTNLTPTQAGSYHAVVTNAFGSVTSQPAVLTVIDPTLADADGDGVSDRREVADGTNPRDAASLRTSSLGLVAHYAFSGNAEDSSGRGTHGVATGAVLVPDRRGRPNAAYRFDGVSARVEAPHAAHQNSLPFSVSVWFRTPTVAGQAAGGGALVSKYENASWNGWNLSSASQTGVIYPAYLPNRSNNVIGGYDGRPAFESGAGLIDGRWHHVVMTVTTTGAILYLDGVEQSRQAWLGTPVATTSTYTLRIGMYSGGNTGDLTYFRGDLDEVRLYQRALTEEDVRRLHAEESESGRVPVDLATWSAKPAPVHTAVRVAWGNQRFVAVGNGSSLVSSDGEAWTSHPAPGLNFQDVVAGPDLFVAGTAAGSLLTSADGITWTARHSTAPRLPLALAHGAGRFVAVTHDADFGGQILSSEDGTSWTVRLADLPERVTTAQWTGTRFLVGLPGAVLSSPDGLTWSRQEVLHLGRPSLAAAAGDDDRRAVAGLNTDSPNDRLWSSEDGSSWNARAVGTAEPVRFLRAAGGHYVGLFGQGLIVTSSDGITWTPRPQVTTAMLTGAAWSGSRWVAVGPGAIVAAGTQLAAPLPSPLLPQTIAFTPPGAQPWNDLPRGLLAQSTSGLPVTLTVVSGPGTLSDGMLTLTGAGTVVVRATQAGDSTFAAAVSVERSITAARATPVLTWNAPLTLPVGTVLTATHLNAAASPGAGTWTYAPAAGSTLGTAGVTVLTATFTPTDGTNYETVSLTRSVAVVSPGVAPVFTTHPASQTLAAGATLQLSATATGTSPLTYQWLRDGTPLGADARTSGVTTPALTLTGLLAGDAGSYRLRATNAAGEAVSNAATLSVLPAGLAAGHTLVSAGYASAGGSVTVESTLTYPGAAGSLGWQLLLPAGWTYAVGSGAEGDIRPVVGQTGLLEWAWSTPPASPVVFRTTLGVPAGQTGDKQLAAIAIARLSGTATPFQVLAKPDPLVVPQALHHSADSNRDYKLSLLELTRVIELYNTRNGTSRTGCYKVEDGTEDGFAAEPTRVSSASATLARHHSADSNRDGKLSLLELTRVIELYNFREGTSRTGRYRVKDGTEDGFEPGT